jgi:hypothetical protein
MAVHSAGFTCLTLRCLSNRKHGTLGRFSFDFILSLLLKRFKSRKEYISLGVVFFMESEIFKVHCYNIINGKRCHGKFDPTPKRRFWKCNACGLRISSREHLKLEEEESEHEKRLEGLSGLEAKRTLAKEKAGIDTEE